MHIYKIYTYINCIKQTAFVLLEQHSIYHFFSINV